MRNQTVQKIAKFFRECAPSLPAQACCPLLNSHLFDRVRAISIEKKSCNAANESSRSKGGEEAAAAASYVRRSG
jgi:hypothetical protein